MSIPGESATPAVDRTTGSISDLTRACLSKFDEALVSQTSSSKEKLETRLADFSIWVDGVGAIARSGLSLDSRLQSRPSDLAIVKSILLMLSDSLDYCASPSQANKSSYDGIQNIDSAIRNLALIGAAIRRTGKASRSRRADRTFNPDEHQELRRHLECLLLLRPKEDGRHSDELDPSKLSALQQRLIDANLMRRHQFLLAQRRSRNQTRSHGHRPALAAPLAASPSTDDTLGKDERPLGSQSPKRAQDYLSARNEKGKDPLMAPSTLGFSRASTAEGTLKYAPGKQYTPGMAKTQITLIASDVEFPESPVVPEDREIFQCPCCCQSLQVEVFKVPKLWKQHVVEDLCPYTCIAENCPTPQLLFCTRSEWEAHVKKTHLPRWQCPFCDENDAKQPSMEAMKMHLQSDHKDELLDKSLATLLSWSAVQTMGIKTCPFCSDHAPEDAPDLVDHVLREAYGFALRALPWPKPIEHDLNKHPGVFKLSNAEDDESPIGRWIREPVPEDENAVDLELCHHDKADHLEPINLDEYTDYFDTCGYFAEAESEDTINRKILASAATQMVADDQPAGTEEELIGGLQSLANEIIGEGSKANSSDAEDKEQMAKGDENETKKRKANRLPPTPRQILISIRSAGSHILVPITQLPAGFLTDPGIRSPRTSTRATGIPIPWGKWEVTMSSRSNRTSRNMGEWMRVPWSLICCAASPISESA
ncbi:hypothetical protein RB597_004265 [Gaeumannomyces tritici]